MVKPTKTNALAAIKRAGATLQDDGDSLTLIAPEGHVFNTNDNHRFVVGFRTDGICFTTKMSDLWEYAIESANLGIRKCNGNCPTPSEYHADIEPPAPTIEEYKAALAEYKSRLGQPGWNDKTSLHFISRLEKLIQAA